MGRDITQLHPLLQAKLAVFKTKCTAAGLRIIITQTFRSVAEQDAMYAQGRTAPGIIVTKAKGSSYSSMHQWGVAFDICRGDHPSDPYYDADHFFDKAGAIGEACGLTWGGHWETMPDTPHFQLPNWGDGPSRLKRVYKTFARFKATWPKVTPAAASAKAAVIVKEDDEVVTTTNIKVGEETIEINRILKAGINYVQLKSLTKAGCTVAYDTDDKLPILLAKNTREIPATHDAATTAAIVALKTKIGFSDETIQYLMQYTNGDPLVQKLAAALK